MPIKLHCDNCQKTLQVADSAAGKKTRCPGCQALLSVPDVDSHPVVAAAKEPQSQAPARSSSPDSSAPLRVTCPSCDKILQVPSSAAGKAVRCPGCQSLVRVEEAAAAGGKPAQAAFPTQSKPSQSVAKTSSRATSGAKPVAAPLAPSKPAPLGGDALWDDLGSMPSATTAANNWGAQNPYNPTFSGGYASANVGAPKRANRTPFYIINGVIIALWGLLIVAGSVLRIVITLIAFANLPQNARVDYAALSIFAVGTIVGLILGVVQLIGGISIATRKGLPMAKTTSIVAAIPCFGGLAFPFGIWAAILVFGKAAKADFRE